MKSLNISSHWALAIGALLVFPTFYFIVTSVLKYGLGVDFLFDATVPMMERLGVKEALGWNINLLILFGPVVATLINLVSVLKWRFSSEANEWKIALAIERRRWNIFIAALGILCLATLFFYLIGENCNC